MIRKEDLLKILDSWNLWNHDIDTGIKRTYYLDSVKPLLKRKEVLVMKGIRRCGKSTIMRQIMKELVKSGVSKSQILYINMEDYGLKDSLRLELFEHVLQTYKESFSPKGKIYFFIDEIQMIPEWERYVRTKYDLAEDIKFIVSGSNASLLARELATKLTGRNLTIEIRSLNYSEFKQFKKDPDFSEYLRYGGFPEVVLEKEIPRKKILLQQYFEDIINKEILGRYDIRNSEAVYNLARYLIQNTGGKQSMNKLSKALGIDDKTVSEYISHMLDAYLIMKVPFFSFSVKKRFHRMTQPKYYAHDNGFTQITSLQFTEDRGKLFENLFLLEVARTAKDIAYWQDRGEVDFIYANKAINVTTSSGEIPSREYEGLLQFKKKHKNFNLIIITSAIKNFKHREIKIIPFEEFCG